MWELSSSVWGWRQQFSRGLIQLNMATHSSFKQTKAAHNDQCCHYGQLIWSGPMCCWFLSFMAVQMCVTGSICVTIVCVWVCVCVPIQINGDSGQRAWSCACPLIGIYILGESLISISLIICLLSVSMSAGVSVNSQLFILILIWCFHLRLRQILIYEAAYFMSKLITLLLKRRHMEVNEI